LTGSAKIASGRNLKYSWVIPDMQQIAVDALARSFAAATEMLPESALPELGQRSGMIAKPASTAAMVERATGFEPATLEAWRARRAARLTLSKCFQSSCPPALDQRNLLFNECEFG